MCGVQNWKSKRKTVISLFLYLSLLRHFGCSEKILDRFSFPFVLPFHLPFPSFLLKYHAKFLGLGFLFFNDKFYNMCTVFFLPSDLSEISAHNISLCLPGFLGSSTFGLLEGSKHANFPLTNNAWGAGVISLERSRKPLLTNFVCPFVMSKGREFNIPHLSFFVSYANKCWKDRANSFGFNPSSKCMPSSFAERNSQVRYTQSNCQQPVPSPCSQGNRFCLFGNVCGGSFPAAWAADEGLAPWNKGGWAEPCENWCKCCLECWRRPQCALYGAAQPTLPAGKIFRTKAAVCFQEPLSSAVLPLHPETLVVTRASSQLALQGTGLWYSSCHWHWWPKQKTEWGQWKGFPRGAVGCRTKKYIFWLKAQGPYNYHSTSMSHCSVCCRNSKCLFVFFSYVLHVRRN